MQQVAYDINVIGFVVILVKVKRERKYVQDIAFLKKEKNNTFKKEKEKHNEFITCPICF